jgi:hypothetical protein
MSFLIVLFCTKSSNEKSLIDINENPEVVITFPAFDVIAYPTRKLKIEPIEPQNL